MTNRVIISGGLGNQMFQYAFALALRHKGYKVKIDISLYNSVKMHNGYELSRIFGINENVLNKKGIHLLIMRILLRFKPSLFVKVDPIRYEQSCLSTQRYYFSGVWLSEKYFIDLIPAIRKKFHFNGIDPINEKMAEEMHHCDSVSVHIRRGDYKAWGISLLGNDYYKRAISIINERVPNPKFYFFSDDFVETKEIAEQMNIDYTIINHNQREKSYQDMYLMSNCKYNVIANSSFSWWGAWLNSYDNKIVISPKEWVGGGDDLHHPQLDSWILI